MTVLKDPRDLGPAEEKKRRAEEAAAGRRRGPGVRAAAPAEVKEEK